MDSLGIQDVFDPYYAGRKPFMPKRTRPRAAKPRKVVGERRSKNRNKGGITRDRTEP